MPDNCGNCLESRWQTANGQVYCLMLGIIISAKYQGCKHHHKRTEEHHDERSSQHNEQRDPGNGVDA